MDWLLTPATGAAAAGALRTELTAFLRRHAEDPGDVDDARLVVAELVGNAVHHAGGPVWVSLDWSQARPLLTVHDLGPAFDLGELSLPETASERGRGLWLVSRLAKDLDDAVVLLDERIAVGDPECRVTVLLGAAARANPGGHHYRAAT